MSQFQALLVQENPVLCNDSISLIIFMMAIAAVNIFICHGNSCRHMQQACDVHSLVCAGILSIVMFIDK